MKKKDEDIFLKSVEGTKKNNKKNRVKAEIPKVNKGAFKKFLKIEPVTKNQEKIIKKDKPETFYTLQKTPINKKLKKGKVPIDKKIDFHGLSVLDAEDLFFSTIKNCYNHNRRCILFVTGKGVMKKNIYGEEKIKLYYGKIRECFLIWTTKKEVQRYILGVEQASIEYGADGAFFVYLRKKTNF